MKQIIFTLFLISTLSVFAGVGGSVGGDISLKNNIESLDYYLARMSYKIDIPNIQFDLPDADPVLMPINEICFRGDETVESLKEIQYNHLDPHNKKPDYKISEIIKRDRKYMKEVYIPHIFQKSEHYFKEDLLPKEYDIKIWHPTSHADHLEHIVHYVIQDCE